MIRSFHILLVILFLPHGGGKIQASDEVSFFPAKGSSKISVIYFGGSGPTSSEEGEVISKGLSGRVQVFGVGDEGSYPLADFSLRRPSWKEHVEKQTNALIRILENPQVAGTNICLIGVSEGAYLAASLSPLVPENSSMILIGTPRIVNPETMIDSSVNVLTDFAFEFDANSNEILETDELRFALESQLDSIQQPSEPEALTQHILVASLIEMNLDAKPLTKGAFAGRIKEKFRWTAERDSQISNQYAEASPHWYQANQPLEDLLLPETHRILLIHGSEDRNASPTELLKSLKILKARPGGNNIELKIISGAPHSLIDPIFQGPTTRLVFKTIEEFLQLPED